MIDLSFSEMLLIAVIAVVVIGPKDLPRVMARVGRWVGQGKAMVRQLRHGFDEMVRETELADMEKRWAEHNRRIMEEHPEEMAAGAEVEMQPLAKPAESGERGETPDAAPTPATARREGHGEKAPSEPPRPSDPEADGQGPHGGQQR